jgi:hypothetical protein
MRAYKYVSAYWYPDEGAEINQPPLPLKKSMAVALILASRITGAFYFNLKTIIGIFR